MQKLLYVDVDLVFRQILNLPGARAVIPENAGMLFRNSICLTNLEVVRDVVFLPPQGDFFHALSDIKLLLFKGDEFSLSFVPKLVLAF